MSYNCDDCDLDCSTVVTALCHVSLIDDCKALQAEVESLKRAMNLHAGDICSINNENERYISANKELEDENSRLREAIEIAKEIIETIDDVECNFPEWWFEASFTMEEYGEEMLSNSVWFERRKKKFAKALRP